MNRTPLASLVSLALVGCMVGCTVRADPEPAASSSADLSIPPIRITDAIDIAAAPGAVWSAVIDVNHYAAWNAWVTMAVDPSGAVVQVGDTVTATQALATGTLTTPQIVTVVTPPGAPGQPDGQVAQFCWKDGIPVVSSLIAPAHHCRTLSRNADGTVHFENQITLEGAVDWATWLVEGSSMKAGLQREDRSLKAYTE